MTSSPVQYLLQGLRLFPVRGFGNKKEINNVGVPTTEYMSFRTKCELVDDLLLGTNQMRAKGERWLPREPGEDVPNYKHRLARSFLYNGLKDTLERLSSKPFSRPVTVDPEEDLPQDIQELLEDMDKCGTNITGLACALFEDLVTYGRCHLLVDYTAEDDKMTLKEEREGNERPVFKRVHPHDLIGWQLQGSGKTPTKTKQIRVVECVSEPHGKYGTQEIVRVRVIEAPEEGRQGTWELHKQSPSKSTDYELERQGTYSFPEIPLLTAYAKVPKKTMECDPPLQDLAEANLCHWQSFSDQRNILRYVRMPILYMIGISPEQAEEKKTVIGPGTVLKSVDVNTKYGYVEHAGAAVGVGRDDIQDQEKRMETLGMRPMIERTSQSTAAGKMIDESSNDTTIQSWVRTVESLLLQGFKSIFEWTKRELPEGFRVNIFNDFGMGVNSPDSAVLSAARANGDLTVETYLRELKRRGIISDSVDPKQEALKAQEEAPTLENDPGNLGDDEPDFKPVPDPKDPNKKDE